MATEIITRQTEPLAPAQYDTHHWELAKQTFGKGLSDAELAFVLRFGEHSGLDIFARHIFVWKQRTRQGGETLIIHPSIAGRRALAAATGEYLGQVGPIWIDKNGEKHEVWLPKEPPAAAIVRVLRKGCPEPITGIALWDEFNQASAKPIWKQMPAHMLGKCAENQAFNKAFPQLGMILRNTLAGLEQSNDDVSVVISEESPPIDPKTGEVLTDSGETAEPVEQQPAQQAVYQPSQSVQDWQQRIKKTNAIEPLRGLYKEAQTLFAGEDWNYLGQCFEARSAELKEAQAIPATTG